MSVVDSFCLFENVFVSPSFLINNLTVVVGNSLAVQWLGLCTFTAKGTGSIPGWRTKILQAMWGGQKNNNNNLTKYRILDTVFTQHFEDIIPLSSGFYCCW